MSNYETLNTSIDDKQNESDLSKLNTTVNDKEKEFYKNIGKQIKSELSKLITTIDNKQHETKDKSEFCSC